VLVEPDPTQAANLRSAGPRDIVVEAGAAFDERRRLTLTKMTNPLLNSFSAARAADVAEDSKSWSSVARKIIGSIEVDLIKANELHLLSIDAEGEDFRILRSRLAPLCPVVDLHRASGAR
jgi:hypothetical protein